ncbi:hypothetical protein CROQUDRAFT_49336, partial [Cronartium quercuum f. sp. fusiforme G11]
QWPFLMIKTFDNWVLLDTAVAFGGVAGCRTFGRVADAWRDILLHEFNLVNTLPRKLHHIEACYVT